MPNYVATKDTVREEQREHRKEGGGVHLQQHSKKRVLAQAPNRAKTKVQILRDPVGDSKRHVTSMNPLSTHPSKVLSPSTVTPILDTSLVTRTNTHTYTHWLP